MKKTKKNLLKLMAIVMPLLFLCSCYEIVYVSQDADNLPNSTFHPEICVQVYAVDQKPITPYIGFLIPNSWKIKSGFPYSSEHNGYSVKEGVVKYNKTLSLKMQDQDPAPKGYYWWVGVGTQYIKSKGVFNAHPAINTGANAGNYFIDYMVGDSQNGLNFARSNDHMIGLANEKTPVFLKATAKNNSILLKWKAPKSNVKVLGYFVYKNGIRINKYPVTETTYIDKNVKSGSFSYTILPLFTNGSYGKKCIESKICYTSCGNSMLFNGKDGKVVVFDDPSINLDGAFAIEAWINYKAPLVHEARIVSKGRIGVGYELLLSDLGKTKSLEFRLPYGQLKSSTPLLPDIWYHVAAVYDGKLMKLYINGTFDSQRIVKINMKSTHFPLVIGRAATSDGHYFSGMIDEVRLWNVSRSANQIKKYFSTELNPAAKGLVGNWCMSEGCSISICDASLQGNVGYVSGTCWSPSNFPYAKDVNTDNNNNLTIPIINYMDESSSPTFYSMEFKINPKLLKFEGIITENTQLEGYYVKTQYVKDGTILLEAKKIANFPKQSDVLCIVDVKALLPQVKTHLSFNKCLADGLTLRVGSGEIIVAGNTDYTKTGIDGINENDVIRAVYPNPATTVLNVEFDQLESKTEIKIMNIMGQEVYQYTLGENESNTLHKINLLGFSKGVYLINLQQNGKTQVRKFSVN